MGQISIKSDKIDSLTPTVNNAFNELDAAISAINSIKLPGTISFDTAGLAEDVAEIKKGVTDFNHWLAALKANYSKVVENQKEKIDKLAAPDIKARVMLIKKGN